MSSRQTTKGPAGPLSMARGGRSAVDDAHHFEHLVRVAPFVVVPGHQLDEGAVQRDAGFGVEDRGARVATEIGRDDLVLGVAQHALERALALGLELGADVGVAGFVVQLDGQVNNRHIAGRHAEGHAGQLLVQLGDDLADGLGRAGAAGDDVLQDAAAAAPVLVARAVHGLLRRGGGVHRGHQAALDAEAVVEHLGHRRQAVRRAAGVADDRLAGVLRVVDAIDEHRRVVLAGCALDHLLRARVDVLLAGVERQEQAGRLHHHINADIAPGQRGRILDRGEPDPATVDDQRAAIDDHVSLEAAMHAVVLQHVGEIVGFEQVVDRDHLDVVLEVLHGGAEDHAADAAEAVDANLDAHVACLSSLVTVMWVSGGFMPRSAARQARARQPRSRCRRRDRALTP
mmetsp:Transcript_7147/g.12849  ORF Transcript_7147/g.12849 Transcript_7147/m.12849 type:complete len:400 (+) Transcript_7147:130-1329(+)